MVASSPDVPEENMALPPVGAPERLARASIPQEAAARSQCTNNLKQVAVFPLRKLLLFALLSVTDFGLTCYLLRLGGGAVYESNPVAAWWLERFGWPGLATFKAAMMTLAAGLGVLIFLRRPHAAHRPLGFSCAAVAAVVLYSGYLCDPARRQPLGLGADEAAPLLSESERLDVDLRRAGAYREVLLRVTQELRDRRCTLAEGLARLAETEQARDPRWMRSHQLHCPRRSDRECLAASVLNHLTSEVQDRRLADNLRAEFRTLYGRPVPLSAEPAAADGASRRVLAGNTPPRRRASAIPRHAGPSAAVRTAGHGRQQFFRGHRLAK